MSSSTKAIVAFGIDLGNPNGDDGWNFTLGDQETEDFEPDDLISESDIKGIDFTLYGYEWTGYVVSVIGTVQTVRWGCEPLTALMPDPPTDAIERFVEYLDKAGLVVKEEYRTPRWLLMESYG